MFENLSLSEFTWRREPILYITLVLAVLNVVVSIVSGDVAWAEGAETIIVLIFGFIARGQVTPVNR